MILTPLESELHRFPGSSGRNRVHGTQRSLCDVLGYWTLPKERNLLGAVLVGTGSYIGVAYYDHYFECSDRLSIDNPISQWFPFVSSLKPPIDYETRTYS